MAVADPTLVDALIAVILILVAVLVENRFGLRKRVSLLWHKAVNSETRFKLTATYDTDTVFENLQDEIKSVFREHYSDIQVMDDGAGSLTFEVDDNFLVTLKHSNDEEAVVETSKITSTMRDMRPEITELLQVVGDFEDRIRSQVQSSDHTFTDESFTTELFLPYDSTFVNTYLPRGVSLTGYRIDLDYPDYDCTIQDTGDSTKVTTTHRSDLTTILKRLLRVWSIWWKRME